MRAWQGEGYLESIYCGSGKYGMVLSLLCLCYISVLDWLQIDLIDDQILEGSFDIVLLALFLIILTLLLDLLVVSLG